MDMDDDGVPDDEDAFPNDPTESADADVDGVGDNSDECANTPAGAEVNAQGCAETQSDSDSDGVSNAADTCPNTPATENANAQGCSASQLDSDDDGVNDAEDAFPNDPKESVDSDGDGVGDNGDAFPADPNESADSDKDGVGNNADDCAATPMGETVNTNGCSISQRDSDGDGVNDSADAFPNDPTESVDTDGDGVGDNGDAFPANPNENADADGDGVGDNGDMCPATPAGDTANAAGCSASQRDSDNDGVSDAMDAFPMNPNESMDSDGDGVGDNADVFPNDPDETADTDADGVGNNGDQCPATAAGAAVDANGCAAAQLDADDDGVSDAADQCPATPADETAGANGCSISQLEGDAEAGATIWGAQCSACHGNYVNDGLLPSMNIDPANLLKTTVADLAAYIDTKMPQGQPGNCVGQCAADAAAFVLTLEPEPVQEPNAANGQALYTANGCANCHGAQGQGSGPFPSVQGATADDLANAIATGSTMPAVGASLTPAQILDLGAFMSSLSSAPTGNAASGQALYTANGCANCHGAQGQGSGPFPSVQGATAADLTNAISTGSTMPAVGGSLTPAQILDLGAFMSGL